ncbi:MAG: potassium-transporting ATPase subunit KdpA [Candidatus Margulisbacteria bacterium]|nr:potassium-transporting ATPase subunit KdpA [Candidatus Margulisiibacteriota bacterium]
MGINDYLQVIVFCLALIALTPPLGLYMARVFEGKKIFMSPILGWLEGLLYKLCGINKDEEMDWKVYTKALLYFNLLGFLFLFVLQLTQKFLPLNPANLPGVAWDCAFNTAASFMTNTNWQSYAGETTMSYLTQMIGLTVQNFLSAATGITVFLALTRGLISKSKSSLGNFWVDMVRSLVYVLLPLAILLAVVLNAQGVVQTLSPYKDITTLQGAKQTIPLGPAASQIAIKQLGTNGGGFFNANSAHPLENPTPLANFLEMLAILLIPAAMVYSYGVMIGNRKHGWLLFFVMFAIFAVGLGVALFSEYSVPGTIHEGQETRLGITNSVIWAMSTTCASNGSVNAMHSSLTPLAGGMALFNIMLGEVVFGGVGSGLYGMLHVILLTVFLAGLMVGRTPEYLGKKIERREVQMVILSILLPSAAILIGAGVACVLPIALFSLASKGPHGLSEILYAFSSASQNNGSAFAGLNANTVFYNVVLGLCMIIGRFGVIIPAMVIAGSLAVKRITPVSSGTFTTDNFLFAALLVGVLIIVGVLTFFPALSLGPIVEHLLMLKGRVF